MKNSFLLLLLLSACSSGMKEPPKNSPPSLISCTHAFAKHSDVHDFTYHDEHEKFISEYFSVEYLENKIVATTLIQVECFGPKDGEIEVSNDTIYLKCDSRVADDRLCYDFHKFKFTISNPENIRYKVVSLK